MALFFKLNLNDLFFVTDDCNVTICAKDDKPYVKLWTTVLNICLKINCELFRGSKSLHVTKWIIEKKKKKKKKLKQKKKQKKITATKINSK